MQLLSSNTDPTTRRAVIVGCGRTGSSLAAALSERGYTVRILDPDPAAFELLPPGMIVDGHIVPILGDGTVESDLRKALTQDANVFIAVSDKDARNALASQIAKDLLQVSTVICRMNDATRREMYRQLGLVTVSAADLVTEKVLESVEN